MVKRGVAFHHAGILPKLKEIVETLFEQGLIKVLYATETFAVGINMPAKTVCFDSLQKYDGISYRYLNTKEYFQLAGRAGRRGIDKFGKSIALVDRRFTSIKTVKRLMHRDIEPIQSQFKLSYNSILNMIKNHNSIEIGILLASNFGYFQKVAQGESPTAIKASATWI